MPDPLDLARCRALAEDIETVALSRLVIPSDVKRLTTALRAACDEVERLRAEVASWRRYKEQIDEACNASDGSYRP